MASFADVQYFIYADIVGGSEKFADVIYGWSLSIVIQGSLKMEIGKALFNNFCKNVII